MNNDDRNNSKNKTKKYIHNKIRRRKKGINTHHNEVKRMQQLIFTHIHHNEGKRMQQLIFIHIQG